MRITAIKSQKNSELRFSIFIDHKYSFSLSQDEIVKNELKIGRELNTNEVKELKLLATDNKLYLQTLKLVANRPKSEWEVKSYLERKNASPALISSILNKLIESQLIDDFKFAEMLTSHIILQSPASRRKILSKLRQKRVKEEAITQALASDQINDQSALSELIKRKTKQSKYQDQTKLMAYLSRQGFSYTDIKSALNAPLDD